MRKGCGSVERMDYIATSEAYNSVGLPIAGPFANDIAAAGKQVQILDRVCVLWHCIWWGHAWLFEAGECTILMPE